MCVGAKNVSLNEIVASHETVRREVNVAQNSGVYLPSYCILDLVAEDEKKVERMSAPAMFTPRLVCTYLGHAPIDRCAGAR